MEGPRREREARRPEEAKPEEAAPAAQGHQQEEVVGQAAPARTAMPGSTPVLREVRARPTAAEMATTPACKSCATCCWWATASPAPSASSTRSTFENLGSINVIPDRDEVMAAINADLIRSIAYPIVKNAQLLHHFEPGDGDRFVDDVFVSPDGHDALRLALEPRRRRRVRI